MNKKIVTFIVGASLCISTLPVTVFASEYNDVNKNHWAYDSINKADNYGFMNGRGDGTFGMGQTLTRAEFASLLVRMFGWELVTPAHPMLQDNSDQSKWYYSAVETLLVNGVVEGTTFRPEENITREEIATMIVNGLGYYAVVDSVKSTGIPFTDVSDNLGYITMAYDFGIISGKDATTFDPKGTALREEAAAMMVRAYDKYISKVDWLHGFYAFSSWGQKELAGEMDNISLGWSRMEYSPEGGVVLNTTSSNNNEWVVPSGYKDAVSFFKDKNVPLNLDVYMSAGEDRVGCTAVLTVPEARQAAIDAIIEELTVDYKAVGYNFYDGVTIDFENLKGSEMKAGFVQFLEGLKSELNKINKKLYVAIQPKLKNSNEYFDGYNFKAIGKTADKVILMAHDYAPNVISADVMASGFTTTPVTPFDEVYYALKTISNEIDDKNKIALALSMTSAGWTKQNGGIVNNYAISPLYAEIENLINQGGTQRYYSEKYRNPYITYTDKNGENIVWYEDARSVNDKIMLAKMFGIKGVSVWRIGIIPNSATENADVWKAIKAN